MGRWCCGRCITLLSAGSIPLNHGYANRRLQPYTSEFDAIQGVAIAWLNPHDIENALKVGVVYPQTELGGEPGAVKAFTSTTPSIHFAASLRYLVYSISWSQHRARPWCRYSAGTTATGHKVFPFPPERQIMTVQETGSGHANDLHSRIALCAQALL